MDKKKYDAFMKQALALSTGADAGERNVQGGETAVEPDMYAFLCGKYSQAGCPGRL